MPRFLNPTGRSTYQLALCDRCQFKKFASELRPDGDKPGLRVCRDCWDSIDPWKLPPPPPDDYVIPGAGQSDTLELPGD